MLHQRGIPSTVLVTERFVSLARATMEGRSMPNAPMVVLPRTELTEYAKREDVERIVEETVATIVGQLARLAARV